MIDIHSHILPGLDDGAPDLKTALKMGRLALKDGITTVIATPHCHDGIHNCRKEAIIAACERFNRELVDRDVPLTILPGAEIHLTPELLDAFCRDELLTLNNSGSVILLELPQRFIAEAVVRVIKQLKEKGVQTIIAHPERNLTVQGRSGVLTELTFAGAMLQITAGSLTGSLGRPVMVHTEKIVKMADVHFLASDSHSPRKRPPGMTKAVKKLSTMIGSERADEIVFENPKALLSIIPIVSAECGS